MHSFHLGIDVAKAKLDCALRLASGKIRQGSVITCTLTGHGLKDPDTAIKQSAGGVIEIPAESDAVKRAILDHL